MAEVTKKRISSLARSYDIPSETLVRFLHESGIKVKSAASMIDQQTFLKVKPMVVAEREKLEREELVKAGKKIPMKAVLKKASKPLPHKLQKKDLSKTSEDTKKEEEKKAAEKAAASSSGQTGVNPAMDKDKPELEYQTQSESSDHGLDPEAETAEAAKSPQPQNNEEGISTSAPDSASEEQLESPEKSGGFKVQIQKPGEPKKEARPDASQPPAQPEESKKSDQAKPADTQAEGKKPAKGKDSRGKIQPSSNELKVSVEKPNAEFLARIQKHQAERSRGRGRGYSGQLGRPGGGPGGGGGRKDRGPRTTAPRPETPKTFEGPRDVFAQRAKEAGITTGFGGKGGLASGRGPGQKGPPGGPASGGSGRVRGGRRRRKSREQIEQELHDVKQNVTKVMASLSRGKKPKLQKAKEESKPGESTEKKRLEVGEYVSIGELAGLMNVMPNQVIAKCMELGMMVTINQRLDHETIGLIADEFGYEATLMDEYAEDSLAASPKDEKGELLTRAPVVTVMGHVDHGKTSILDYVRKTNVIAGESGSITQHIGAYLVETAQGQICFLDTPGHEAFSSMRSRGANITDVVLLVVAADSMVMPQTKESIQMAKNTNSQIVVAINKIDLENANPDKIKTQLAENGVEIEEWGGKYQCVEVSAKTGKGMDRLLETLALEAEVLELKANPNRSAQGTVLESRLDRGMGAVATVLVQNGTLKVGDSFVTGIHSGKVRAILDERGQNKDSAGPSTPVQVLGLTGAPQAGDSLVVVDTEREARDLAERRRSAAKDRELRQKRHITLDQLYDQIKSGDFHELNVIIKGDVDGSVEAIASSLERLSTPEVKVNVVSKAVGTVTEGDIHMAEASNAIVIAFHVLPSEGVRNLAEAQGVTIHNYRVIYEIVDEIKAAMEGLLSPEIKEEVSGEATIRQVFRIPKVGFIAGCYVESGMVDLDSKVRLYRGGIEVAETRVTSLKRNKDTVKSVRNGYECGIGLESNKEIQEGDVLAFFKKVEIARKLSTTATNA